MSTVWRHWAAPGLTAVGSITVLPPSASIPLLVGGFIVAGAASFTSTRISRNEARRLRAKEAELGIIQILQTVFPVIENFNEEAPSASQLRACLMTLGDTGALRIACYFGSYSRMELELEWHEGQGLPGAVLGKKTIVKAPEDMALPADISGDPALWQLTDDQRRAIAGKSSTAIGYPLTDSLGEVRAVLLLEDCRNPDASDLRRAGIGSILERRVVTPIREQLAFTGFTFAGVTSVGEAA